MRFLASAAAVILSLFAQPAFAATIQTQDTIAGLQTQFQLSSFSPNAQIPVTVTSPAGSPMSQSAQTDGHGNATVMIDGSNTEQAGTYTIIAGAGQQVTNSSFKVLPDRVDLTLSTVTAQQQTLSADGQDSVVVSVTLYDRFQNPLPDRPVTLIPSRTVDVVTAEEDATDANGEQRFTVSTTQPGTIGLRAMDLLSGMVLQSSAEVNAGGAGMGNTDAWAAAVAPMTQLYQSPFTAQAGGGGAASGLIDHFVVTVPASMEVDKEASSITITAVDKSGKTVEDYTGTINFTSTDPQATLPNFGTYTFKPRDLGVKKFPLVLKFRTPGPQRLHVEDAQDNTITGDSQMVTVTGSAGGNNGNLVITSPTPDQVLGGGDVTVSGNGPPLINIVVKGGLKPVNGDTDQNGQFTVDVPIDTTAAQAIFTVEDDEGRYPASAPVTVRIDATEPTVDSVTFTPAEPEEGTQTLVVVKAEPKLRNATVTISKGNGDQGTLLQLLENANSPGTYQTFFTAPAPGTYQPTIQTTDTVGNVGKYLTTFTVDAKSLPTVSNLAGEAKADAVQLSWDSVDATVDGYRIYIGESPDNFQYTLDTGVPQTKATVRGLLPGQRYYFAVTALKGNQESKNKSQTLALDTIGIHLDIVPSDGALTLNWSGVPQSLTLQSYILEYGVAQNAYTEKRVINGDAQTYTLHDLINTVPYYLRLTPLLVTGEKRDDLAVTATGTPSGDPGFHATPGDPVDVATPVLIGPGHEGAPPENVGSGPTAELWVPAIGLTLLLAGAYLYRRQKLQQTEAFLRALNQRNRV